MQVDASRSRHLLKCLQAEGASSETVSGILRHCKIPENKIWPVPKTISYLEEALLVRAACDLANDVSFAAQAALSFHESTTITGYIGRHSRNLGKAIENTARFHDLIDPALSYGLRVSGNFASFELDWKDASYAKYHRHTEYLLFLALSRMRHLTQTDFYPIEIRFDHQVRNSADRFSKLAGFPVTFGSERPEILLSLSSLTLPIPTYDPSLRDHLTAYGERLLSEVRKPDQSLRAKVEGQITASLPGRMPPAEEVAANLGMSARTFARRLREFDLSYRTIVDELRFDLAKTFIKDGMSLIEVAFTLGYADQASFSTAFKRWSGQSPSSYATS